MVTAWCDWLSLISGNVLFECVLSPWVIHLQMRLEPTVNDVQLSDLFPNTEYAVTVQAVLHDLTSEPVTAREVTCKMSLGFLLISLL